MTSKNLNLVVDKVSSPSYVTSMKITFSPNIGVAVLKRATALAEHIESKQAELRALLNGQTAAPRKASKSVSKRANRFTPAQRASISEGLRRKWAERKAAKAALATPVTTAAPSA